MSDDGRDPFDSMPLPVFVPFTRWQRLRGYVSWRLRSWWCAQVGHDVRGGEGFNGEYVQHWWQCRRCGEGDSD